MIETYQDYELPMEDRFSLAEIERCINARWHATERMVREHMNALEDMNAVVTDALRNEESIGYRNATLLHDHNHIKSVMNKLELRLQELDKMNLENKNVMDKGETA